MVDEEHGELATLLRPENQKKLSEPSSNYRLMLQRVLFILLTVGLVAHITKTRDGTSAVSEDMRASANRAVVWFNGLRGYASPPPPPLPVNTTRSTAHTNTASSSSATKLTASTTTSSTQTNTSFTQFRKRSSVPSIPQISTTDSRIVPDVMVFDVPELSGADNSTNQILDTLTTDNTTTDATTSTIPESATDTPVTNAQPPTDHSDVLDPDLEAVANSVDDNGNPSSPQQTQPESSDTLPSLTDQSINSEDERKNNVNTISLADIPV
eukprot:c3634_g1_i1.p1 GENE.c3634_g1_i1~~c3634_g1_i1.p1  ORF type:complete len:268 (-),score=68.41 c3634_g1_i1:21-824(-)